MFPIGMQFPGELLAKAGVPPADKWTHGGEGAIVSRWTNGWSVTMWEVEGTVAVEPADGNVTVKFGNGGQQPPF